MSPQIALLQGLVRLAEEGNQGAIDLLRDICSEAAKKAPVLDLIMIGQQLIRIGDRSSQDA